jgi:hypothetical protein
MDTRAVRKLYTNKTILPEAKDSFDKPLWIEINASSLEEAKTKIRVGYPYIAHNPTTNKYFIGSSIGSVALK